MELGGFGRLQMSDVIEEYRSGAVSVKRRRVPHAERVSQPVWTRLARVAGVHTDERSWRAGARGEELVAKELSGLGEGWCVLHAIPAGEPGSDIDHLVIGTAGVFCLETKHHKRDSIWVAGDVFMVNGQRQPYIRDSRYEARRVSRILASASGLPIVARGVVVVVNANSLAVRTRPNDVDVVNKLELRSWLLERPNAIDRATVERVSDVARRSSIWSA